MSAFSKVLRCSPSEIKAIDGYKEEVALKSFP
jgi:hypothetical protein